MNEWGYKFTLPLMPSYCEGREDFTCSLLQLCKQMFYPIQNLKKSLLFNLHLGNSLVIEQLYPQWGMLERM
jgi:hypothetical protein